MFLQIHFSVSPVKLFVTVTNDFLIIKPVDILKKNLSWSIRTVIISPFFYLYLGNHFLFLDLSFSVIYGSPLQRLSTLTRGPSHSTYIPWRLSQFHSFHYQPIFMTPICVFLVPTSVVQTYFRLTDLTTCWISSKRSQTWHELVLPY